jgi:O-acetylhomoserine (thiol)-lyase
MEHICRSAQQIAEFLHGHPAVKWVRYPGLPDDPDHALAQKYLPDGTCGVMAFAIKGDRAAANRFMDHLQLVTIETHVADCYTCILHPASHTHRQLSDEQLREAGVDPDLMRLSIGLEDPRDIIGDLTQALREAK